MNEAIQSCESVFDVLLNQNWLITCSSDSLSTIWFKAKAFLCSTLPYYTIWNVDSKTQKAASFSTDPALTDTLFLGNALLSFIFWDGNSKAQNSKYSSIDTAVRTSLLFLFCQTSAGRKSSSLPEAPPRIGLPRLPETIVVQGWNIYCYCGGFDEDGVLFFLVNSDDTWWTIYLFLDSSDLINIVSGWKSTEEQYRIILLWDWCKCWGFSSYVICLWSLLACICEASKYCP